MVRVGDVEASLAFWCDALGLSVVRRTDYPSGRFTLIFLASPDDLARDADAPMIELTHNWDPETLDGGRNFGHVAYAVPDIYAACARLVAAGVTVLRPPRDGRMAFVRSPDGISVELLQDGPALPSAEPWASMPNVGVW
jgi:lactoylglutathione lyase